MKRKEIPVRFLHPETAMDCPRPAVTPTFNALETDHHEEPLNVGEVSRMGPAKSLPNVEILYGSYRRFSFARHFHSVTALGVVETGAMRTYCQGSNHRVPAGSVILFNPGDVHAPQSADGSGWSFRMIYLDDSLLKGISVRSGHDEPLWFSQPFANNPAVFTELLSLHHLLEREPEPLAGESQLVSVLQKITQYSCWAGEGVNRARRSKVERAREYLHEYATDPVSLRTLSDVADLSPWHLLRSFREHVGLTPHAYQMQARVERGRMLLSSGVPIAETALTTGFVDQSHFTRQFKRFTGVTPGRYSPVRSLA